LGKRQLEGFHSCARSARAKNSVKGPAFRLLFAPHFRAVAHGTSLWI